MKTPAFSILVGALIAVAGIGLGSGWHGFGHRNTNHMTVTGESRLVGEPDLARVTFGVAKSGKTVTQAQDQVSTVVGKVIAAVARAGVKKEDVATSDLTISQAWDYRKRRPSGYDVSSTLTITVRNVQHVGRVIDAAVAAGLNRLQGVSYDVRSPEWRKKALQEALSSARRKAEAMAAGLGRHLGQVVSVQEVGMEQASPADEFSRSGTPFLKSLGYLGEVEAPRARSLPGQRAMMVQVVVEYEL